MRRSVEFLAGVLVGPGAPLMSFDDFLGPHGPALRVWQRCGFLATEPEPMRVPSCPHCGEGVPMRIGDRLLCETCFSAVDPRHLSAYRLDLPSFLAWLARELHLDGDVRPVDGELWQLGGRAADGLATEYFFCRSTPNVTGRIRLSAYRSVVLLRPLPAEPIDGFRGRELSLLDVLTMTEGEIVAAEPHRDRNQPGTIRFDADTGALWVGDALAGEVPIGTKEYHLLACLAEGVDRYVAYADLKHEVLRRSGSRDTTEEATFCQKLKGRIKKTWVPAIDRLVVTTNKGDGYRLRGRVEPSEKW
jgi:DNA-binding winged helix-turn-helix (wHTH) protein